MSAQIQLTREQANELKRFIIDELGGKLTHGIKHVLISNETDSGRERIKKYMALKEKLLQAGFNQNDILRKFDVCNGVIFDIDINVAASLAAEYASEDMGKDLSPDEKKTQAVAIRDMIKENYKDKRENDLVKAAGVIRRAVAKGETTTDIVLFSRNTTNTTNVVGKVAGRNEEFIVVLSCFTLNHFDICDLNVLLQATGLRIDNIQVNEILPSKTGVRTTLSFRKVFAA